MLSVKGKWALITGAARGTGYLVPKMIERGFGRIVNTTSGIRNQPQ